jgi:hypothetical protein
MDGIGHLHVKQNKPDSERQISHFFSYVESRFKKSLKVEGNYLGTVRGPVEGERGKQWRVMG